jgi:hypothetical protein
MDEQQWVVGQNVAHFFFKHLFTPVDNGIDHASPFIESTAADIPLVCHMLKTCIIFVPLISNDSFKRRPVHQHPDLSLLRLAGR